MTELYLHCLAAPAAAIDGKIFNAGYENHPGHGDRGNGAGRGRRRADRGRAHGRSQVLPRQFGQGAPRNSVSRPPTAIEQAIGDLRDAFQAGEVPDPMNDPMYYNIKRMQELSLQ